jgi:penicillin-binding protein 1C
MQAWVLEGVVPPTFAERQARLWNPGVEHYRVDASSGLRLSATCTAAHVEQPRTLARWPALASPWLPKAWRAAAALPALAPDCADDGRTATDTLVIEGVQAGTTLKQPPGQTGGVKLSLRATGASGPVQWLLDGRRIGESEGALPMQQEFSGAGLHELTALADNGAWSSLRFTILD